MNNWMRLLTISLINSEALLASLLGLLLIVRPVVTARR
jgi:hypothetical protein